MLQDHVAELEEQKTRLLLSLKEYRQKYEQQKTDQADIYYYLNKKLDENYETIAALEEQILTEQADRETHERSLEKRIHTLELEMVTSEAKYTAKLNEAEEKLAKLKEFGDNKEELDRNLEKLLDTLENERRQFRSLADEMDRRSVQERDRIRKECSRQFEEYKKSVNDDADDKLSTKTKKTIAINSMIKTELKHQVGVEFKFESYFLARYEFTSLQSKQADQVLVYNQQVLDRDRELRQELELSRVTQTEMVNRLALYQRLIKQLNERISTEVSRRRDTAYSRVVNSH
jgi:DNA repair exonuclease SbcCD ATPase subunit